jgi:hypothetical protein
MCQRSKEEFMKQDDVETDVRDGAFVQQFPYLVAEMYVWVEGPDAPARELRVRACIPDRCFEHSDDTETGRVLEFHDMSPMEAAEAVEHLAMASKDGDLRIEIIRVEVDRVEVNYEGALLYSYEVELS